MSTRAYDGGPDPEGAAAAAGPQAGGGTGPGGAGRILDPEPSDGCPDITPEARVREALRGAAAGVRPSPWRPGAVADRARRRRRGRRVAVTLPAVAAVLACAGVTVMVRHQGPTEAASAVTHGGPTRSPTTTGPTPSATPGLSFPPIRYVQPGQAVSVGAGQRMKLEPTKVLLGGRNDYWVSRNLDDGNMGDDTVGLTVNGGDKHVAVVFATYKGTGTPARMTVTFAYTGATFPLRIVTLTGNPGYAMGYVDIPLQFMPSRPPSSEDQVVMVYGADGTVLATLGNRAMIPTPAS